MITLRAKAARAEIVPEIGGGLAGLWWDERPVLRPWTASTDDDPFSLACNVLAPFSNRISGGFLWRGQHRNLTPNRTGEAFPIHGDAFQKPWQVVENDNALAILRLADGRFGPWTYHATLEYRLESGALSMTLKLVNRAAGALPYGLGFHPWFPRDAQTRLCFHADGVWMEDERHLPADGRPTPIPDPWNFAAPRPLPENWINNGFSGWDRCARVVQGSEGISVLLRAGTGLDTLIVYAPEPGAGFFCAEPVSHPVDAHNLPGRPGLVVLDPGKTLVGSTRLEWAS